MLKSTLYLAFFSRLKGLWKMSLDLARYSVSVVKFTTEIIRNNQKAMKPLTNPQRAFARTQSHNRGPNMLFGGNLNNITDALF